MAAAGASDTTRVLRVDRRENEFTGEETIEISRGVLPPPPAGGPAHLLVTAAGAAVCVIDGTGRAEVWNTRDVGMPSLRVSGELASRGGQLTAVAALLGRQTVLAGEANGAIDAWFTYEEAASDTAAAAIALGSPRHFAGDGSAVTALAASARERVFIAGYENGSVRMFQATSGKRVIDIDVGDGPVDAVAFSPKNDGSGGACGRRVRTHFDLDLGYPEVTLRSMFRPGVVRRLSRARARLAVVGRHRRLRTQVRHVAARLRHAQGDVLLHALRRAAGTAGGDLHQRVRLALGAAAPEDR